MGGFGPGDFNSVLARLGQGAGVVAGRQIGAAIAQAIENMGRRAGWIGPDHLSVQRLQSGGKHPDIVDRNAVAQMLAKAGRQFPCIDEQIDRAAIVGDGEG